MACCELVAPLLELDTWDGSAGRFAINGPPDIMVTGDITLDGYDDMGDEYVKGETALCATSLPALL